jgi:hypothetical protein
VLESQAHVPFVVSQRSVVLVQDPHAAPPDPHNVEDCEAKGMHVLPLQQPFGHELASQTHSPFALLQSCSEAQDPHAAPLAPHEVLDSAAYSSHVPVDEQQPAHPEVELHTHCPLPLHIVPVGHPPQAAPPAPHEVFDWLENASHVLPPLQHPEHVPPLEPHEHSPPEHDAPREQGLQALPAAPHSALVWEPKRTHALPLQQPVGHVLALQTHTPFVVPLHTCPEGSVHAAHAAPPVPQDEVDCAAYGSHVPVVPPLQQPFGQVVESHEQLPVVPQPLAQPAHASPPLPHWVGPWEA